MGCEKKRRGKQEAKEQIRHTHTHKRKREKQLLLQTRTFVMRLCWLLFHHIALLSEAERKLQGPKDQIRPNKKRKNEETNNILVGTHSKLSK
jgi:hypothetical protein